MNRQDPWTTTQRTSLWQKVFVALVPLLAAGLVNAQTLVPFTGSNSVACGTNVTLQDHAGTGNYSNSANGFTVLNGGGSAVINISGSYSTEASFDFIRIYSGSGTGGAIVFGPVSGSGSVNYTGPAGTTLTVQFTSDGSVVGTGFSFTVTYTGSCSSTLQVPVTGSNSVACGSAATTLVDNGGAGNYASNSNGFTVFNAANSAVININGSYTTESGFDFIRIFSGSGTGGAIVFGPVSGSGSINYTGAAGQTLTVQFTSDGSVELSGFSFTVTYSGSCLPPVTLVPFSGSNSVACGTNTALQDHAGTANYSNSANGFTVLNALGGAAINISGSYVTESSFDFIRIYSGSGTGGAIVFGPVSGTGSINYTGAVGQTLTVQFTSDGSVVYSGFNLTVTYSGSCVLSCVQPTATGTRILDCANNRFFVSVNVTSVGSGGPVTIVNSGGAPTIGPVGVGTYQVGPFTPITTSTTVTVNHGTNATCNVPLGTFTGSGVLCNDDCTGAQPIVCGTPINGTNVGATADGLPSQASGGEATVDNGVWYVLNGANQAVTLSLCTGTTMDSRLHVFRATSCAGPFTGVTGNDDFCGVQSQVNFNALTGNTYYILVEGYFSSASAFTLTPTCTALCVPIPTNEDCGTAQPVTVSGPGSCASQVSNDNHCAASTAGNPTCFGTFSTNPDLWYSFTPPTGVTEMIITNGTATSLGYAIYSGACGSLVQVSCSGAVTSGAVSLLNLTAGTPYKLRILSAIGTAGSFTLCLRQFAVPAQDNCPGVDLASLVSPLSATTTGSNADFTLTCGTSTATSADHVYYIDVPDQNTLRIGDLSSAYNSAHELRSGATCPGTSLLTCSATDLQQESYVNISGTTQRVWWIQDGESGANGGYQLQWQLLNCIEPSGTGTVQIINCATTPQFYVNVNLTSLGNAPSVNITSTQGIGNQLGITTTGTYQIGPFTAGTSTTVTIVHNGNNGCNKSIGTFTVPAAPLCNDFCADAIPVSCGNTYNGTNVGATADGVPSQASGGESTVDNGVWYIYTPTPSGELVTASLCTGTTFDTRIHIFQGSCGSLVGVAGADDVCGVQSSITWNALPGITYYIAVEGYFSSSGPFQLAISCGPLCNPLVYNDLCANAQAIIMSSNCQAFGGNLSCATNSAGNNPSCIGGFAPYPDAFYTFTATAANAFVTLTAANPGIRFVLYNGTCTTSQFYCSAIVTSGVPTLVTGLTNGNPYTLRVMQLSTNAGAFTLCVQKLDVTDDPCQAVAISCGDLRFGRTIGYTNNMPSGACPYNGAASTGGVNYFKYVATSDQDIVLSTCGQTAFDTRLSVFSQTPDCTNLTCNVLSDNAPGCPNNSSEVILRAHAGQTYIILVHGVGAAQGNYQMSVFCQPWCAATEDNDRCPNAATLASYVTGSGSPSTEQQACAYTDGPTACSASTMVQGVWYTFNTGLNTLFDVYLANNTLNGAYSANTLSYALYSGSCTAVGSTGEMVCATNVAGTYPLPVLAQNTNYRLLVYNVGGVGAEGTFGLKLSHPGYNDAGISVVDQPVGTVCDQKFTPTVWLKNFGEHALTSVTINSYIDGNYVQTYAWTGGPILRGDSLLVTLPLITSPVGVHSYTASTSLPDGATDELATNDGASSFYDASGQTVKVVILTDNNGAQTSWTIYDLFFFPIAQSPPNMPSNTTTSTAACLPTTLGNCYYFFVFDAGGDGMCCLNGEGSWALLDVQDRTILEDKGQFTTQSPPVSAATPGYFAHEFCLPLGPSAPVANECGIFDNLLDNKVYCNAVVGVTLYQFEFSDPDAGFRRRIALPRNWVKFGEMQTSPLVYGTQYFCRVRVDQGATGFSDDFFGKGCEMALAAVQPICTHLVDQIGLPTHSCGVTKRFGGSDKIYAQPVSYATQYRFNFVNVGAGYNRNILKPSYTCLLSWVTQPLVNGTTYDVKVECFVSGVWSGFCGATCQVTINNPPSNSGRVAEVADTQNSDVQFWPNPVRDGHVNLVINGIADEDQHITIDVYDIFGKRVMTEQYENAGEVFNTVLDLGNGIAAGVYTVNITVNERVYTQRLSVQ